MHNRICPDCGGPRDILHTPVECAGIKEAVDVPDAHRYHVAVIAAIIDRAPSSIVAAYRLYADGLLSLPSAVS